MLHTLYVADANPSRWTAMRDYVRDTDGLYVVADNDPTPIGISPTAGKWARRISSVAYAGMLETVEEDAAALAAAVNALTATGYNVVIDEARNTPYDSISVIAIACHLFDHPAQVFIYLVSGTNVTYAGMDTGDAYGLITSAIQVGANLLPEVYINQFRAERSGNIQQYIDRFYRGPEDGKMPYLLEQLDIWGSASTTTVHFIYPVIDRFYLHPTSTNPRHQPKMPAAKFLDLVMQRGALVYPRLFFAHMGPGTWRWASHDGGISENPKSGIRSSTRDDAVVGILRHYTSGDGLQSKGKKRYYRP